MTTVERPDMNAEVDRRLRAWMTTGAASPDLSHLLDAVVDATRGAPQRRRLRVPARNRRSTVVETRAASPRRLGLAVATALALTVAIVAGLLIGARLLRHDRPLPGVFRATSDLPTLAGSLDRAAVAVLPGGRILFAGAGDSLLATVVFDPATETYGPPSFDKVIRRGATATTLQNSLVLLTGGEFGQSDASSFTAALFDARSGTVAETSPMNVSRSHQTATLLDDGRVLVAGGRHYPGTGSPAINEYVVALDSSEIYDPATGNFTETGPMNIARAGHSATKLPNGRVLIAGGYSTSTTGRGWMAGQAEIFDPATGTFRLVGPMVTPRGDHSATLLRDGRVLLVGGAGRYGSRGEQLSYLNDAELFDPVTETFAEIDPLVTERAGHSATMLGDGRVLLIGGRNERGGPRTSEVFDPTTDQFELGTTAAMEHHVSVAPLLADGRVLAAGSGVGGSEIVDPRMIGVASVTTTPRPSGTGAFSPVTTSAMRRGPMSLRLRDGRVLMVAGATESGDGPVATFEIFDPTTGLSSPAGTLPGSDSAYLLTQVRDGRVLLIASDGNGRTAMYYDPLSTGLTPALAVTKALVDHELIGVAGTDDGSLILADGMIAVVAMDPDTGRKGLPIRACGTHFDVVGLADGRVLIPCEGANAVIVDLDEGTTEQTGLRFERGIRLGDGRVALTTGGFGPFGDISRVTEIYDPASRSVVPVRVDLPVGKLVAVDGGGLFAFGGTYDTPSDQALEIDPQTWASRDIGPMLGARSDATATALADGRILVIGGARVSPDRTVPVPPEVELFDPSRLP